MTVNEAKNLLGLKETDEITERNMSGLLSLRETTEELSRVWSRSKLDKENDKKQLEAIDLLISTITND